MSFLDFNSISAIGKIRFDSENKLLIFFFFSLQSFSEYCLSFKSMMSNTPILIFEFLSFKSFLRLKDLVLLPSTKEKISPTKTEF